MCCESYEDGPERSTGSQERDLRAVPKSRSPLLGEQRSPPYPLLKFARLLADKATNINAARHLVRESAWLHDQNERNTKHAAMAKRFAADMCNRVVTDALQIHGGYGYNTEYPVEKLFRDAKIFQIYEGTSQIQRMIISREIFKEVM